MNATLIVLLVVSAFVLIVAARTLRSGLAS